MARVFGVKQIATESKKLQDGLISQEVRREGNNRALPVIGLDQTELLAKMAKWASVGEFFCSSPSRFWNRFPLTSLCDCAYRVCDHFLGI